MKKSKKLILILILIFVFGYLLYSDKPFETMTADEIKEIQVYAIPPSKEVFLDNTEIEYILPLLQDLKVSKPGYQILAPMGGQTVKVTILKSDGSKVKISNFGNVMITIDRISYRADYESAEALNVYANKVLKTGF